MSLSIFEEKTVVPTEERLKDVLENSYVIWCDIVKVIKELSENYNEQWKFYSKKAGWSLVAKSKDKTILYMIPQAGYFKISFVYGEKAVESACNSALSKEIIDIIKVATPYVEGRSFMLDVKTEKDINDIKELIAIKIK